MSEIGLTTAKFSSEDYKLFILMMDKNGTSALKELEEEGVGWVLMTMRSFNSQVQSVLVQVSEVYSLQPRGKGASWRAKNVANIADTTLVTGTLITLDLTFASGTSVTLGTDL
ncbi:hypothetical protein BKA70DRAFT_1234751 [Coprinopsis sp. MPI-PUGE-AT-0042]|nr:hypothetical protein BKA70DRAFT_1234751 [Coprinopsis sp. MPI-PUGE-AT-0042]